MSTFKEYVAYRSLHQKFSAGNTLDTIQSLISAGGMHRTDENGNLVAVTSLEEAFPEDIKNLCAKVPAILVDQLDQVSAILGISKREFMERALWEAVDEARAIYDSYQVGEYLDAVYGNEDDSPESAESEKSK